MWLWCALEFLGRSVFSSFILSPPPHQSPQCDAVIDVHLKGFYFQCCSALIPNLSLCIMKSPITTLVWRSVALLRWKWRLETVQLEKKNNFLLFQLLYFMRLTDVCACPHQHMDQGRLNLSISGCFLKQRSEVGPLATPPPCSKHTHTHTRWTDHVCLFKLVVWGVIFCSGCLVLCLLF